MSSIWIECPYCEIRFGRTATHWCGEVERNVTVDDVELSDKEILKQINKKLDAILDKLSTDTYHKLDAASEELLKGLSEELNDNY